MNRAAKSLARFFQSQQEVAKLLGIKGSQLSLLIAGKRKPSIEVAAAIEQHFGVPCRWWIEEADESASSERCGTTETGIPIVTTRAAK